MGKVKGKKGWATGRRRCVVPGCERYGRRGRAVCPDHVRSEVGQDLKIATRRVASEVTRILGMGMADEEERERRRLAAARFRRRLERGDYGALFDPRLRQVMGQAAAERSLRDEIGALRVVLARLLVEEQDPRKQAAGVAKVAAASVRAVKTQHELNEGLGEDLMVALDRLLMELDGG